MRQVITTYTYIETRAVYNPYWDSEVTFNISYLAKARNLIEEYQVNHASRIITYKIDLLQQDEELA